YREFIRKETYNRGQIQAEVKEETKDEKKVFKMYYEYTEAIRSLVSHRTLALNRGEKEGVLKIEMMPPTEVILTYLDKEIITKNISEKMREVLEGAIEDSYKRLIQPAIERELRNQLTEKAEKQAIAIFSENLKNLLLQPPLKGRTILGVDPAFRTGCKLAVIDETGKVFEVGVMYPTAPRNDVVGAEEIVMSFINKYGIELIAIGNGTASRETEQFIADMIQKNELEIP